MVSTKRRSTSNTSFRTVSFGKLEIIGEATKGLSREVRAKCPDVPWQDIAGMRDKLIHDYFGADLNAVWLTPRDYVPVLKAEVARMLEQS